MHDAYVELMRTYWTLGKIKDAKNVLRFLEKELKKKYSLAEVDWLWGRMYEESGNFKLAVRYFSKGAKEHEIDEELTEKILWGQAWNFRKIGNNKKAAAILAELKNKTSNEYSKMRFSYWLGRSYEDMKKQDLASTEYKNLMEMDPFGYYGLLAHRQAKEKIPLEGSRLLVPLEMAKVSSKDLKYTHIDRPTIEWLLSLGEMDIAQSYLDSVSKQHLKSKNQTEDSWLAIFSYYARAGDFSGLYKQLGQMKPNLRDPLLKEHPDLLFPRPFSSEVRVASQEFDISRELIYSIMRQESAFDPRARSHADAFGLMQMLPENARKKAHKLNVPFDGPEDLFNPEKNIILGSAFMKDLWDRYSGQFILAVSSYNASDDAIRGWIKTRFKGDSVAFIEDVPYEETRGYIRLVMRNLVIYNILEADGKRIDFPEWVLQLKNSST
ncbi:MAG: transglycosylase SLT domain-containing protein [Bdellovibrionales bacterium]|nr:transglycosylase SLT domain-containing protein [Bdellovibrionales bacterium]